MSEKVYKFLKSLIPFAVYVGGMLVVFTVYSIYASSVTSDFNEAEKFVNSHLLELTTVIDALLIPVFYLMWRNDRRTFPIKRSNMPAFSWSILVLIGASSCVALNYFLNMFMPEAILESYSETSEVLWNENQKWLSFLSVVIVAPLCEELMFRGLIYTRMRTLLRAPYVILISGFLFGFFHGNALQFIYAMALGMLLAYVMEAYRSIWAPIMVHVAANLISWLLTYIVFIPSDENGALDYSVLAGTMLITATGLFGIVYIRKVKNRKPKSEEEK